MHRRQAPRWVALLLLTDWTCAAPLRACRPDDGGQASIDRLRAFMDLVNSRGIPLASAASTPTSPEAAAAQQQQQQQQAAAAGSTSAVPRPSTAGAAQQTAPQHGRMASTPGGGWVEGHSDASVRSDALDD